MHCILKGRVGIRLTMVVEFGDFSFLILYANHLYPLSSYDLSCFMDVGSGESAMT